jgi:predicted ferric reductase
VTARAAVSRTFAFLLYLAVPLAPLGLALIDPLPSRGLAVDVSVALGFVSLAVLGLQPLLAARLPRLPFTLGSLLRYHRQMTLLAVGAAFAHPAILLLSSDKYRPLLQILDAPVRALLGWLSLWALASLVITSVWRKAMNLSYPAWQALHAVMATVVVLAGVGHALRVGYYTGQRWQLLLWMVYTAAFLWLMVWVRLLGPLRRRRDPWVVEEVRPEPGQAVTVRLMPVHGTPFEHHAGQFAWLSQANPLRMDSTPYTIASPPGTPYLEFTVKPVGPSSRAMQRIHRGDRFYVDGPHGSFTLEDHPGPGYVFIAAGVGVTPFLSILSDMVRRDDPRPCMLFLGNRSERDVPGGPRLAQLARWPNLQVVHVMSRPSPQWAGERGRVDYALLHRFLPFHYRALQFFVCASDEATQALVGELRRLNVPAEQIHTEGFGFV